MGGPGPSDQAGRRPLSERLKTLRPGRGGKQIIFVSFPNTPHGILWDHSGSESGARAGPSGRQRSAARHEAAAVAVGRSRQAEHRRCRVRVRQPHCFQVIRASRAAARFGPWRRSLVKRSLACCHGGRGARERFQVRLRLRLPYRTRTWRLTSRFRPLSWAHRHRHRPSAVFLRCDTVSAEEPA